MPHGPRHRRRREEPDRHRTVERIGARLPRRAEPPRPVPWEIRLAHRPRRARPWRVRCETSGASRHPGADGVAATRASALRAPPSDRGACRARWLQVKWQERWGATGLAAVDRTRPLPRSMACRPAGKPPCRLSGRKPARSRPAGQRRACAGDRPRAGEPPPVCRPCQAGAKDHPRLVQQRSPPGMRCRESPPPSPFRRRRRRSAHLRDCADPGSARNPQSGGRRRWRRMRHLLRRSRRNQGARACGGLCPSQRGFGADHPFWLSVLICVCPLSSANPLTIYLRASAKVCVIPRMRDKS